MKRKILMGMVALAILFGGVVSIGALADERENAVSNTPVVENNAGANEKANSDDRVKGNQTDDNQYDDDSILQINRELKISKDEAIAIATKDTPGNVIEVELDDYRYYEIEVKNGQYEVEYKIDANTGAILEKDIDRDDD